MRMAVRGSSVAHDHPKNYGTTHFIIGRSRRPRIDSRTPFLRSPCAQELAVKHKDEIGDPVDIPRVCVHREDNP